MTPLDSWLLAFVFVGSFTSAVYRIVRMLD